MGHPLSSPTAGGACLTRTEAVVRFDDQHTPLIRGCATRLQVMGKAVTGMFFLHRVATTDGNLRMRYLMVLTKMQALPELFNVGTQDVEPYTTTLGVSTEVHAVTTTTGELAPQRQEYIELR